MIKKTLITIAITALALIAAGTAEARTLSVGSTGSDVSSLQTWLIGNGYPIPLIESGRASKGYFGEQTRTAVRIYQEDKGLSTTGVIDSDGYLSPRGPILGAVSGPDFYTDYFNINGVRKFYNSTGLINASTTVCSIKAPNATSTLELGAIRFRVGTTSAMFLEFAQSTSPAATTTKIGSSYVIAANAQATIVASSTQSIGQDASTLFAPNTFFVVKAAFATAATSATVPQGACKAVFTEI